MSTQAAVTSTERSAKRRALPRLPEPLAAVALFVLSTACAALVLARPRALVPDETPSLLLPAREVAQVIAADAGAASKAPHSAEADALRRQLTKQGEMELIGAEKLADFNARRKALQQSFAAVVAALGEPVALRLRAESVQEFDAALDLKLPVARARIVIGSLGAMLQREGASLDGQLLAPRFVVRTLYKARWNLLHGLGPAHRFERVEQLAYYGWEALHAERLPIQQRVDALQQYAKAGGQRVQEALGVLYYRHDEFDLAATALAAAYAAHPSVRLRNYVLGAQARAAMAIEGH